MQAWSWSGKEHMLVVVDDYKRVTWVLLLVHKSDTLEAIKRLCKKISNDKNTQIKSIRSDRQEFLNEMFLNIVTKKKLSINFLL